LINCWAKYFKKIYWYN